MRAARPKATMIMPAIRLIHDIVFALTFFRKKVTPSLKISHQKEAPKKIPVTRVAASTCFSDTLTRPSPAKTATKERRVRGLEMVKKNVETKSERKDRWGTLAGGTSVVVAKKVFTPKKSKKHPPSKWM